LQCAPRPIRRSRTGCGQEAESSISARCVSGHRSGRAAWSFPTKFPAAPTAALVAQNGTSGSAMTSDPAASSDTDSCQAQNPVASESMLPASNSTSGLIGVRSSGSVCEPRLNGLRLFAGTTGSSTGGGAGACSLRVKPPTVSAFQLCAGSSMGCNETTSTIMPPSTFPVATSTSRFGASQAGAPSAASPGIEPAATWSSAPLQLDGRLGGKSNADVATQKLRSEFGRWASTRATAPCVTTP